MISPNSAETIRPRKFGVRRAMAADARSRDSELRLALEFGRTGRRSARELPFEEKLLDSMHDAVLFVDAGLRIVGWNHAAERLTGIAADSVCRHPWSPSLLNMQDEKEPDRRG